MKNKRTKKEINVTKNPHKAKIFICSLLTYPVSGYIAPNDSMTINNQLEGM
jgi:hypothetical protein